jgi:hypothetical protein
MPRRKNVDGGIPNNTKDFEEYKGWQIAEKAKWEDKLHVDNAGHVEVPVKKLVKKTASGKQR